MKMISELIALCDRFQEVPVLVLRSSICFVEILVNPWLVYK